MYLLHILKKIKIKKACQTYHMKVNRTNLTQEKDLQIKSGVFSYIRVNM